MSSDKKTLYKKRLNGGLKWEFYSFESCICIVINSTPKKIKSAVNVKSQNFWYLFIRKLNFLRFPRSLGIISMAEHGFYETKKKQALCENVCLSDFRRNFIEFYWKPLDLKMSIVSKLLFFPIQCIATHVANPNMQILHPFKWLLKLYYTTSNSVYHEYIFQAPVQSH